MSNKAAITVQWTGKAVKELVGKTIRNVRYMTEEEAELFGWYNRALVIFFEDGTYIIPQSDDEGNDAGALSVNSTDVLPVLSI